MNGKTRKYFNTLIIEPTNRCNLMCPICPTGSNINEKLKGDMTFQQFKNIINSTKHFLKFVNLWGYGEPFLAPDIMKMINYTGENDIKVNVHTNGNVLNKKTMDQFKENHKVAISFSVDGLTRESYSYYRRGGNLKKVLDNLSYLVNLKRKHNLCNLEITWQFLINKGNEHEAENASEFARKIGVDYFKQKTINVNEKHPDYNDFIPRSSKYKRKKETIISTKSCIFIDPGMPNVFWDGDVLPCCRYYKKNNYMGNVFKKDLIKIWDSKVYRKFRDDHKKGTNKLCNRNCGFSKKSVIYINEKNFTLRS